MFAHVPTLPSIAHDWQRPEQSEWQQTPSKQKPLLQPAAVGAGAARFDQRRELSARARAAASARAAARLSGNLSGGARASPPPPAQPPSASANASAIPARVMMKPETLDMLQPASGISAFGRRTAALKPARRTCEHPYPSAIDCYGVEILTSSNSAIVFGTIDVGPGGTRRQRADSGLTVVNHRAVEEGRDEHVVPGPDDLELHRVPGVRGGDRAGRDLAAGAGRAGVPPGSWFL